MAVPPGCIEAMMPMMERMRTEMANLTQDERRQIVNAGEAMTQQLFANVTAPRPGDMALALAQLNALFSNFGPREDSAHQEEDSGNRTAFEDKRIVLCNLTNRPDLNGRLGTCIAACPNDRLLVMLDPLGELDSIKIKIKRSNARFAMEVDLVPLNDALVIALKSDDINVLQRAMQRASTEVFDDKALVAEVAERLKTREEDCAKARALLMAVNEKLPPLDHQARAALQQTLFDTLAAAVQVRLPDDELASIRNRLCDCFAMSFQNAIDSSDATTLEHLLHFAKDVLPLLGSEQARLETEVAIAEQRLRDVKDAAELALERADRGLPDIDIPDQFICPITRSLMCHPVVASDGFSYEREAIEEHLKKKNTSPQTNQQMENKTLHPNTLLKQLIRVHEACVQEQLKAVQDRERIAQIHMQCEAKLKEDHLQRENDNLASEVQRLQQLLRAQRCLHSEDHPENTPQGALTSLMTNSPVSPATVEPSQWTYWVPCAAGITSIASVGGFMRRQN